MLVQDHDVTIINTQTGQIIRELTIDPTRDYQPIGQRKNLNLQNGGSGHTNLLRHHSTSVAIICTAAGMECYTFCGQ